MTFDAFNPEIVLELSNGVQNNMGDIIGSMAISLIIVTIITFVLINIYVQRQNKIIELSIKDPLTKQYNRRYILDKLEKNYNSGAKEIENKFAVFIDVDDFKAINDKQGHIEGDKVLCDLCETINRNIRVNDYLARMGGDEFLLIISIESAEKAKTLVERIVSTVEKETKVTISAGLTPLKGKKNLIDLLDKADNIMYMAKKSGKNKVLSTKEDSI
jgi:polar amino acid transport system substrate-binding protein